MMAIALLGVILIGSITMALRMGASSLDAIDLDPAVLLGSMTGLRSLAEVRSSYAFEPLREALASRTERDRNRWLVEADATWHSALRPLDAEMRACARAATSASFCAAAWALRAGIASRDEAGVMAIDGPVGQGVVCIALGLLTTGAIASIHRRVERHLRDERAAFASLLLRLDEKENVAAPTECRA